MNLAFPLVKDTFSMLGSSRCEVLLVINLKDTFHSMICTGESKKFLFIPENASGIEYVPSNLTIK